MNRTAIWIASVAFVATVAGAAAFALEATSIDPLAAILVLAGQIIVAATGVVGVSLVRAPWGRWSLLASTTLSMLLAAAADPVVFWTVALLGAAAIVGLSGPWLRLWLRHQPAAEAPGPVVILLVAVAPTATLFVALTSLSSAGPGQVALVIVAVVSSVAYAQGAGIGLWGLRIGVPIAAAAAVPSGDGVGALLLVAGAGTITVVAWLPHAKRATAVITPPLPSPHRRSDTDAQQ